MMAVFTEDCLEVMFYSCACKKQEFHAKNKSFMWRTGILCSCQCGMFLHPHLSLDLQSGNFCWWNLFMFISSFFQIKSFLYGKQYKFLIMFWVHYVTTIFFWVNGIYKGFLWFGNDDRYLYFIWCHTDSYHGNNVSHVQSWICALHQKLVNC